MAASLTAAMHDIRWLSLSFMVRDRPAANLHGSCKRSRQVCQLWSVRVVGMAQAKLAKLVQPEGGQLAIGC